MSTVRPLHHDVAVADQAGAPPSVTGRTEAVDQVVQPPLQHEQEVLTRDALVLRLLEVVPNRRSRTP